MSGPLMVAAWVLLAAGFTALFISAARSHPPRVGTQGIQDERLPEGFTPPSAALRRARSRRDAGPWRAPKGGGYQVDEARPEPHTPPRGRAGTSG